MSALNWTQYYADKQAWSRNIMKLMWKRDSVELEEEKAVITVEIEGVLADEPDITSYVG